MAAEDLQRAAAAFPVEGYLRIGDPRRSSWTNPTERALAFFWEPPSGGAKLVRTQAPYVVRVIQRYFGADIDGVFGEQTRAAIEAHARRAGLNVQQGWAAGPALLGYALSNALLGGGVVLFPGRNEFPDPNNPRRLLPVGQTGSTYVGVLDLSTRREEPLGALPGTVQTPAPPAPPAPQPGTVQTLAPPAPQPGTVQTLAPPAPQPGTVQTLAPPAPQPINGPWTPDPSTVQPKPPEHAPVPPGAIFMGPPASSGTYGVPGVPAQQAALPQSAELVSIDGALYVLLNGTLFQYAPQVSAEGVAGVHLPASPYGGLIAGALTVGAPRACPPGAVAGDDGVCRLKGYAKIPGAAQAIPNTAGIVVDFARPETYRNANLTPGVLYAGGIATLAGILGAAVGR